MKRKSKAQKIKITYTVAEDIPEEERERRLDAAFDILFDAVAKTNWRVKE